MNEHYIRWDELAPRGLMLVGLGLCLGGEAVVARSRGRSFLRWCLLGLAGLACMAAGISLFGDAVKHRTLYELEIKDRRQDPRAA